MTLDKFKEEVQKLIEQLVQTDDEYDVFVMTYHRKTGTGKRVGYGCEGCMYDKIQELRGRGYFQHTRRDETTH